MKLDINNYPGSKNASGVIQFLFNNFPRFSVFVEMFGGSAKISSEIAKRTDCTIVVFEKSESVADQLETKLSIQQKVNVLKGDSLKHYSRLLKDNLQLFGDSFFYFDPPYLFDTRKSKRNLYNHEWNIEEHEDFLHSFVLKYFNSREINCAISHPRCELYEKALVGWYSKDIEYMTRGGVMTDTLWMNYDISKERLASTAFLGGNYKERQAYKRKKERWVNRLNEMPLHERQMICEAISDRVQLK